MLLACARLHARPEDRAELLECARAALDWECVLRLARWHGLRPLLHRHLAPLAPGLVPRPVLVELWGEAETIARHNRAMARELARVAALLDERGIRALPFKGPALALAAYGDVAMREFGDLDILLDRGDIGAARAALCASGYAPAFPLAAAVEAALMESHAHHHLVLRSTQAGLPVELHWKSDPAFPVERTGDAAWWNATAHATVEGAAVRAFVPEDLLLLLCVHAARHHWSSLAWLVDVAELLRSAETLDWAAIARRAHEVGCLRHVGVGLELARTLLAAPLPPAARALTGHPAVAPLARAFAQRLLTREPAIPGPAQAVRLALALHDDARGRVRQLFDIVFLPSLVEWTRWPLPRGLFFLYPVLRIGRLAAKYAGRAAGSAFGRGRLQP